MNGRKLFREYAQSKGKEAVEFVQIIPQFYNDDVLETKNQYGHLETTSIDYKQMVHWMIKTKKNWGSIKIDNMNTQNILIADFDDRKYNPRKGNRSVDIEFDTYDECAKWISDNPYHEGHVPTFGWGDGCGHYDTMWDWLMPVIEKIGKLEISDEMVEDGDRTHISQIYPRTFGMINEDNGKYMFRFNGHCMWESETLLGSAYLAVLDVLQRRSTTDTQ